MAVQENFKDYYAVLQVWPTASDDVIKKAYFSMAKLHHPDISGKEQEEKGEAGVDFKMINEAYNTLIDPVKRRVYDEQFKKLGRDGGVKHDADKRSAKLAFEQAKTAMKHNRYDKAAILLKSAVNYDDSNPAYHSWFGFALAALNTRLHEARDACKKALELEFYNAEYHANLGFVYYQAGLKSTANESFEEALKWDPENPIALRYHHDESRKQQKKTGFLDSLLSLFKRPPARKTIPKKSKT